MVFVFLWGFSGLLGVLLIKATLAHPYDYLRVPPELSFFGFILSASVLGPFLFIDGLKLMFKWRSLKPWKRIFKND